MFEDSLFATNRRRTPQQRWAALLSFLLQAAFVTVLVGLPLFFTEALPLNYVRSFVELPSVPHSGGPPPAEIRNQVPRPQSASQLVDGRVIFHPAPTGPIRRIVDGGPPPEPDSGPYIPGGNRNGTGNTLVDSILSGGPAGRGVPLPEPPKPRIVRVSVMDEGLLIHKVTPEYPPLARAMRQQGTVLLHAIIGRDGSIQQLQAVSGPPLLIKPAVEAVSRWRYRPYVLNGQPVEVETQITVNFKLGG